MVRIFPAQSGSDTASWNDTLLHSRYDPVKEAYRFVRETPGIEGKRLCIVLEPGLGYVLDAVSSACPDMKIVVLHLHEAFYKCNRRSWPSWCADGNLSIENFLSLTVEDDDLESLSFIEWPPARRAFPELASFVSERVLQYIRERQGSILTSGFFGRRWIRNSILNFMHLERFVTIQNGTPGRDRPVLVAASGPSLEPSLPIIAKLRDSLLLWALPSSLDALSHAGLRPDLIVLTDPGHYSAFHLFDTARNASKRFETDRTAVAMPLSAATGVWRLGLPVVPLSQEAFYETELLSEAGLRATTVPANGTVSGTALHLSRALRLKTVVFAGLDFCTSDIRSHVRPHAFERFDRDDASRLRPWYGRVLERTISSYPERKHGSGEDLTRYRTSAPLRTYAGWFSGAVEAGETVYRLEPSPIEIPGMRGIDTRELETLCQGRAHEPNRYLPVKTPTPGERVDAVRKVLDRWIRLLEQTSGEESVPTGTGAATRDELVKLISFSARREAIRTHGADAVSSETYREAVQETVRFLLKLKNRCSERFQPGEPGGPEESMTDGTDER
jgi:hypothetical protein